MGPDKDRVQVRIILSITVTSTFFSDIHGMVSVQWFIVDRHKREKLGKKTEQY